MLIDDVIDYTLEKNVSGKNIGDDFKLGKTTLPIILAWKYSDSKEKDFWIRTIKLLKQNENDFEYAKRIMKKYNIIEECKKIAGDFINISLSSLDVFPNNKYKTPLKNLANESLRRKK